MAAALVHRAIGSQLTCVYVDTGLMRKGESDQVVETFKRNLGIELVHVDAADEFFDKLQGVIDPEQKRKVIGETFVRIFERYTGGIKDAKFLVQGTLYPDVIESGGREGSAVIKSHHNVGGLPDDMTLQLCEPLRELFKDEVRSLGTALGLPDEIVWRQPFPGPGLGVRIIGEVTREKVSILQEADAIVREEIQPRTRMIYLMYVLVHTIILCRPASFFLHMWLLYRYLLNNLYQGAGIPSCILATIA